MNFKYFYILFFFNSIFTKNELSQNQQKELLVVKDKENLNFIKFSKKITKNTKLNYNDGFLYYIENNVFYYFNVSTYSFLSVNLNIKCSKFYAYFFNGKNLYIADECFIFILDDNFKIESTYNIGQNFDLKPRNITFHNDIIYVFSFNKSIFAFSTDYQDSSKINFLWRNDDCFSIYPVFKFNYIFKDDFLYIFEKDRLCIINSLNGSIIKNFYLKNHYDNMIVNEKNIILSKNMSFCDINLDDFKYTEGFSFTLFEKKYTVNFSNIKEGDHIYNCDYVKRFLTQKYYFAYKNDSSNAVYLLINENGVSESIVLKNFNISNVFLLENNILLVDGKNKQFKFV